MSHRYSAQEYLNMIFCYGRAEGNLAEALRQYGIRHPESRQPRNPRVILNAVYRVRENQRIVPDSTGGRGQISSAAEEAILQVLEENPRLGVRTAARVLRQRRGHRARHVVSYSTVWKVLRRNRQIPYKLHKVQALIPGDAARRMAYCRWLLQREAENVGFTSRIMFTDESTFTNNGMWNRRNSHWWSSQNPYQIQETGFQTRWKWNVWAGIVGNQILGPYFLPSRMDGPAYLDFLNHYVAETVDSLDGEDVPLAQLTWFQHDGAPPHTTTLVRRRLNELFGRRWIGRHGPQEWPARSPDLTPLDFFLWGYVKDRVYDRPTTNADIMRQKIVDVFDELKQRVLREGLLQLVHSETLHRARVCLRVEGRQFEPYLVRVERPIPDDDDHGE